MPLKETWKLFWHKLISAIQRTGGSQHGRLRGIKGSQEFGGERLDSSVCHPGGSKIVELCSCQLLQQQILLIRPSAPPETGINSMVHQNVYKLTSDRVE